jgi:hypothetical protein
VEGEGQALSSVIGGFYFYSFFSSFFFGMAITKIWWGKWMFKNFRSI